MPRSWACRRGARRSRRPARTRPRPPSARRCAATARRCSGAPPVDLDDVLAIVDAGDVVEPDGPEGEASVRARVRELRARAELVIALGGDNSATYAVAQGMDAAGLITIDAHFDLRDGVSNGSPVRRLVEDGLDPRRIVQLGIADFANSAAYARRAAELGITVVTLDDVRRRGVAEVMAEALEIAGAGAGARPPRHRRRRLRPRGRARLPRVGARRPRGVGAARTRAGRGIRLPGAKRRYRRGRRDRRRAGRTHRAARRAVRARTPRRKGGAVMTGLVLVRHAKSDWGDDSLDDHDRPLSEPRAARCAADGRRLRDSGFRVDAILSSTALRARTTAAYFAAALGLAVQEQERSTARRRRSCCGRPRRAGWAPSWSSRTIRA